MNDQNQLIREFYDILYQKGFRWNQIPGNILIEIKRLLNIE